jgi:hypothetical protein
MMSALEAQNIRLSGSLYKGIMMQHGTIIMLLPPQLLAHTRLVTHVSFMDKVAIGVAIGTAFLVAVGMFFDASETVYPVNSDSVMVTTANLLYGSPSKTWITDVNGIQERLLREGAPRVSSPKSLNVEAYAVNADKPAF